MNRVFPLLGLTSDGFRAIYQRLRTDAFGDRLDLILLKIKSERGPGWIIDIPLSVYVGR